MNEDETKESLFVEDVETYYQRSGSSYVMVNGEFGDHREGMSKIFVTNMTTSSESGEIVKMRKDNETRS